MLKQLIIIFICLVFCPSLSNAQGKLERSKTRSYYTYIYQVSNKEAQNIYEHGPKVVSASYFHSLVDSFAVKTSFNKTLPKGHYLFMHSNGPDLEFNLRTYAPFDIKLLQVKPALSVLVHDSTGNPITNADVRVQGRKAVFDQVTKNYRLNKTPKDGLVAVSIDGFTLFEKLEKVENYHNRSLISKIIYAAPIRFLWRPFYDLYKSVRWLHPQGWVRSVFSIFDEQYRRSERSSSYRGYLVTNKPKYQPGDTVKYKAFIVEKDGGPVKGNALLKLSSYGKQFKSLGEIKPYRNGAFEGYFILHDSLNLELDRHYILTLYKPGKKEEQFISGSFSYEDYELKENAYTLALKYQDHQTGRANSIMLHGTNANDLNLLDAIVEITVKTHKVVKSEQPVIFIPDTLWVHRQPLDAVGKTVVAIPDSIFPAASVDYTVTATFLNSNNERTSKSRNASYVYSKGMLKLSLLQDSLLVQYLEGDSVKPREAELSAYNTKYDDLLTQQITLPVRIPLNAYAEWYEVQAGKLSADLDLSEKSALITLQASRIQDSIYFALQNPRRLPYWYYVYRGEKLVMRGQGKDVDYFYKAQAKGDKPYFVVVQYMWAGKMQKLQEDAPLRKHLLTIGLQAPQVVYPGQKTDMKVAVTDAGGKPVPNVDLTAYAITSKFKDQTIPNLPTWDRYKKQKPIRVLEREDDEGVRGKKLMDWNYWGRRMGLDSITYYNFLYPAAGVFTSYSTTIDSITQVSPFVVDSGRVVPVHVVYLDEVPVYFSQTDVLPAYAFAADSGFHTIKLRTTDKLITLDSVYLKHRQKLIVSADITASENPYARAAEKKKLSSREQHTLYKYLFYVQQDRNDNGAYLKQGNRIHLLVKNSNRTSYYYQGDGRSLIAGSFKPDWMQYVRLNSYMTNFRMEPAYSYHFEPNLLKMREQKMPDYMSIFPVWDKWERKPGLLQHQALTESKIQESWEAANYERLLGKLYTRNSSYSGIKNFGRIGWNLEHTNDQQVRLVLLHKAGKPDSLLIYPRESAILHNLKPATYTLTLLLQSGDQVSSDIAVRAGGQTQVYFTLSDIEPASQKSNYLLSLINKKIDQQRKDERNKTNEQQQLLETIRQTTYSYSNGSEHYGHEVTGVVRDKQTGEALPGVAVVLKGTNTGATTNEAGRYRIFVPEDGVLVFRFIGYVAVEEKVNGRETILVDLEVAEKQLQEVVVTGYGVQERRSMTASVATSLQGSVAGVMIRGNSSINVKGDDAKPLVIVDGVPYSGDQVEVDNIVSTKVLKGEEASALYGAAGAAGVIIITTKRGGAMASTSDQQLENINSIRNNFSDYGIWQPRLITDKKGEASFKVIFPDDITSWNTYVLAMDNKKHSGIFTTNIKSFKAMMATLHLPRFLVEGDKAQVVGKALNYLPDSSEVTTYFEVNGIKRKEAKKPLNKSFIDTLHITAPAHAPDSVEVLYSLRQESGFADGERRFVSIYPKGVEETIGYFLPLYTDTTFTLFFDPAKGPVTLHTEGDLLKVMLDEIDYLHKYEYWCSEQAASKLKGLVLEKQIRKQLGQPFEHDRMVKKLIRHLEKTQLKEGGWAWWQEGTAHAWITNHVAEALVMAKQEGYAVKYQEQQLIDHMVYQLESSGYSDKLTALETLYKLQAKVDFARYILELEKKKKPTLEEQLRLTRMRQQVDLPVQLDTLQKYKNHTILGGLYWGEEKFSLFNNSISNTLLAYEILNAAGKNERELAKIRAYLLNERRSGHWRNTYESARVLETLLPDLLKNVAGNPSMGANTLSFSGAVNFINKGFETDTTFEATKPLMVKKQGKLPVYLTAYQKIWNIAPEPVDKDFVVTTSINGHKGNALLKAGIPVEMQVEVEVKEDAAYVMIEVPIPASCSYESKTGRGAYEVHREYYRNKVSVFSDRLPKGKYVYTIKLLPRYNGTYTLNPAKAELMYFPTFYGRNGLKQVFVE